MLNSSNLDQTYLRTGILSRLYGEVLRHQHDAQLDFIIQNVSMDITQKIINMDQLLEHNIQSARRRYKNISRIAYEQVQLLIKRDQQDRNVLIDTEMKKIVEVSQQYSIPVDIMKLKESILQLVRKK